MRLHRGCCVHIVRKNNNPLLFSSVVFVSLWFIINKVLPLGRYVLYVGQIALG